MIVRMLLRICRAYLTLSQRRSPVQRKVREAVQRKILPSSNTGKSNTGLWLVNTGHVTWILISHWFTGSLADRAARFWIRKLPESWTRMITVWRGSRSSLPSGSPMKSSNVTSVEKCWVVEVRKSLKYCVLLLICKLFQGVLTDTRGCTQIQTRTNAATAQRHSERLVRSQSTREYTLAPSPTPAPTAARASEQPPSGWCISDLTRRCGHLYLTYLCLKAYPTASLVWDLLENWC